MVEVLIQKIKENCTNVDLNVVNKAFNFAFEAHKEQKRESGEPYIIHPVQLLLDYILQSMLLGVSGLFDCKNKNKIFIGCLLAVLLKETSHILSGCIYFAEYAWDGWNPIAYSIVYNLSGGGTEGLLSTIVLTIMPLSKIKKMANIQTVKKAI